MTLTVTHAKVSAIADDANAAAKGEVLPSDWNANHTITGVALEQAGGNLTFYVATTGSDSNNGTSALTPFRTIQHAISIGLGFFYQSLYTLTINIADGTYNESVDAADGLLFGPHTGVFGNASIIGNVTNPGNVRIAPTSGFTNNTLSLQGGFWYLDGITIAADTNTVLGQGFQLSILAAQNAVVNYGTINLDSTSSANVDLGFIILCQNYARILANNLGAGTGNVTVTGSNLLGSGGPAFIPFFANIFSTLSFDGISINFATDQGDLTTWLAAVFAASNNSILALSGTTFVTPTNWHGTGIFPVQLSNESALVLGADPTSITWPTGAFNPDGIDQASNIDGNFYALQKAGLPANTDMYEGAFRFIKDTSGGGVYAAYNDAGTIKKVALT